MAARDLAEIERALDRPGPDARCFLLYGADESGSRALAARLATALGPDAERIDLTPAQLKADPALLADEAASSSLFGGARHIRVEGVGEDCLAAVEALLEAPAAGNPVVLIGTATLKKDGKLAKRVAANPLGRAYASYAPEGRDAERIAATIAQDHGLRIDPGIARRLADACNNDRAILTREIEKLALYADATPDARCEASHAMLDAIGIDAGEADMARLLDALFAGDLDVLDREIARAAADGQEGIPLIRTILRRVLPMAMARAEMDRGASPDAAIDKVARFLFWRDRKAIARDLPRWSAARLGALVDRLSGLERELKSSRGPGTIAADHLLFTVARSVARR
jgi:DNA polymerase-3 subunit delta